MRGRRLAIGLVVLTACSCVLALVFRTPIRSRLWAARLAETSDPREQARLLSALIEAGEDGRCGVQTLLQGERGDLRQMGVLALHQLRTSWANERLVAALDDADADVRELAALGLALHGDERVIPRLEALYRQQDAQAAGAACIALLRMGTPAAENALCGLVEAPTTACARQALVEALDELGNPAAGRALLRMLTDNDTCAAPLRRARLGAQAAAQLDLPATLPAEDAITGAGTIAEQAAAALNRLTGLELRFSSELDPQARVALAAQWSAVLEQNRP